VRRSQQDAALEELYKQIPKMMGCDGRCWISCGPVAMSARELARIKERGYKIMPHHQAVMRAEVHWCEALTEDHRCAVYESRPLICRLWGTVETMKCPYGCVPEGGWVSDAEAVDLIAEAETIGGSGLPPRHTGEGFRIRPEEAGLELRMQYNLPAAFRPKEFVFQCPSCGFALTMPPGFTDRLAQCAHCRKTIEVPR
jgi:hypothetical protein